MPAGGLASDSAVLAPQQEDGVLFILDAQKKAQQKGSLRQTVRSLKAVGANVLGTVISRANVEELSEREATESHQEEVESQQGEVEKEQATKKKWLLLEFAIMLLVSFAVLFGVIKPFIVEAFYVPTESMVPTLEVGDRVLTNKFIYRFSEPERGDIVVFESADGEMNLIKRVVGLPGDKITVVGGSFYVNDERQREPYVNADLLDERTFGPIWVPEGHIFAMGDNRADSADSRVFGPVPKSNIVSEAFLRVWPPGRLGSLEAPLP